MLWEYVNQRSDEQQGTCQMLPLTSWQCNTPLSDVLHLLLSLAHFSAAKWQSSLMHLQRVQSVDFYPFSCYLKGNYALWSLLYKSFVIIAFVWWHDADTMLILWMIFFCFFFFCFYPTFPPLAFIFFLETSMTNLKLQYKVENGLSFDRNIFLEIWLRVLKLDPFEMKMECVTPVCHIIQFNIKRTKVVVLSRDCFCTLIYGCNNWTLENVRPTGKHWLWNSGAIGEC